MALEQPPQNRTDRTGRLSGARPCRTASSLPDSGGAHVHLGFRFAGPTARPRPVTRPHSRDCERVDYQQQTPAWDDDQARGLRTARRSLCPRVAGVWASSAQTLGDRPFRKSARRCPDARSSRTRGMDQLLPAAFLPPLDPAVAFCALVPPWLTARRLVPLPALLPPLLRNRGCWRSWRPVPCSCPFRVVLRTVCRSSRSGRDSWPSLAPSVSGMPDRYPPATTRNLLRGPVAPISAG